MNLKNPVIDFAERTKVNLEIIRNQLNTKPHFEVFEVTQLVNSMMGLLIFPKEEYWFNKIRDRTTKKDKIKYSQAISLGWPLITPSINIHPKDFIDEENSRFGNEVKAIRNAFAHNNLEFKSKEIMIDSEPTTQIADLELKSIFHQTITWQANLSIAQLEKIADVFLEIILRNDYDQND